MISERSARLIFAIAIVLCLSAGSLAVRAQVPTVLPDGFEQTVVATQGGMSQFAIATDGTFFFGTKNGFIEYLQGETRGTAVDIDVDNDFEQGLNGIAIDPDYAQNGHVWVYYTDLLSQRNRVTRFRFNGGAMVEETILFEGPVTLNNNHAGGSIRFAEDGTLFVGMGDDGQGAPTAQDLFDPRGKVLHFNRDGSAPSNNPFADGVNGNPYVWAYGFRNPYRVAVQPVSGTVFVGDVGSAQWEEIDAAIPGHDFGWPTVEGPHPAGVAGPTYPILETRHNGGSAIIGGAFVEVGDLVPEFEGDYIFGDWSTGVLTRIDLAADGATVLGDEVFATGATRVSDIQMGDDGALYYVSRDFGPTQASLRRIEYDEDRAGRPLAVATATPDNGPGPLSVMLDGSASSDPDGQGLTYHWELGDGATTAPTASVNHSYPAGEYVATLTVDDGNGGVDTQTVRIVSDNTRPVAQITTPADGASFVAGQVVSFDGQATDTEDGALACAAFVWRVLRIHGGLGYPVQGPEYPGCSGTYTVPLRGMNSDDTLVIQATAADSGAALGDDGVLKDRRQITLSPSTADLTFSTEPLTDLDLSLDGEAISAPHTVPGLVQSIHSIGAPAQTRPDGRTWTWLSWSDGGGVVHDIATGVSPTTFTATFGCDVLAPAEDLTLSKNLDGTVDLAWTPVVDDCLISGPGRYRIYAAATASAAQWPGSFPHDPAWTVVGTSEPAQFSYLPGPNDGFFLVVGVGSDQLDGALGHYGE
ncbi:MAG: PKD domain-containing protein [bacterium]|nr:PKD domain-containing protein [bacterium]